MLLAIALAGILVAVLLWAIGGGSGRGALARPELADRIADSASSPLSPPLAAERAPASTPGTIAPEARADDPDAARSVSRGLPFRGQVVDVRTGEPVPSAIAKAWSFGSTAEAPTDAEGRFASDARLPSDFEDIEFWNAHDPAHIRTAPRRELESLGPEAGWLARIRIGPTFRLRLLGAGASESDAWTLRVVESAPDLPDRATAWIRVVPGDPPWARFDNPLPEAPPGASERIEVQNQEATLRGTAPIETIVGIHPGLVTVPLDQRFARVLGRVVDSAGKALSRAEVSAIPRLGGLDEDGRWPGCRTDGEGRYAIGGLPPGGYWVHARPRRGEETQTLEIVLPLGDTTAPDLVAPAETAAGAIEGFLKTSGELDFPLAVVRLRAVDGRSYEHFDVVDTSQQAASEGQVRLVGPQGQAIAVERKGFFEFQQVPAGEYEITVIATDGSRWTPTPLRVRPPRLDLEILREEVGKSWTAWFHVSDAESGASLDDFHVQILVDEAWTREVRHLIVRGTIPPLGPGGSWPEGARFRWNVHADGYRLASGTERDFVGTRPERVAEVRLRRGFGARLLLRDAQGRFDVLEDDWAGRVAAHEHAPVEGARILADGELVATSDARGVATFETIRPPQRIEILAPGWTVLGSAQLRGGRIVGDAREILVWLAR